MRWLLDCTWQLHPPTGGNLKRGNENGHQENHPEEQGSEEREDASAREDLAALKAASGQGSEGSQCVASRPVVLLTSSAASRLPRSGVSWRRRVDLAREGLLRWCSSPRRFRTALTCQEVSGQYSPSVSAMQARQTMDKEKDRRQVVNSDRHEEFASLLAMAWEQQAVRREKSASKTREQAPTSTLPQISRAAS